MDTKKEQTRLRVQRYRDKQKALHDGEDGNAEDVTPDYSQNVYFRPQPQVEKGTGGWHKTRESLQWGIDTGRIRCRREVVEAYDLTPKYGPALLDKHELLILLNNDIKLKKIDAPLHYLEDDNPEIKYSYSKDWYK